MKHVSSVLNDELALILEQEDDDKGQPWYGDPWSFDVRCTNCGHVHGSIEQFCPMCDSEEAIPVD